MGEPCFCARVGERHQTGVRFLTPVRVIHIDAIGAQSSEGEMNPRNLYPVKHHFLKEKLAKVQEPKSKEKKNMVG